MKEFNEMSLKELFEVQQRLGKAIEERVRIGQDIRKRKKKIEVSWINLDTGEVEAKEMTYEEYKKEIG